jgi:hypothetical protein
MSKGKKGNEIRAQKDETQVEMKENERETEGDTHRLGDRVSKRMRLIKIAPWMTGAIIGFLAASLQKIASMTNPPAYGFCMACHGRDLINGIVNFIAGQKVLGVAQVIANPIYIPALTVVGVLFGSFVAALLSKEFRVTKGGSHGSLVKMFIIGFLVMIFALIISGCPIRTSLRVAHGDIIAFVGLISLAVGAVLATMVLQRSVKV